MPRAFVLFIISPGTEEQVLKDAKKIGGVEEAYVSYSMYDLIVKVRADSLEGLKELAFRLRKIENVTSVLTLMMIE